MQVVDWQVVLEKYGPIVWQTTYRLLGNHADAADCFQEAFVGALEISRRQRVRNFPALLSRLATARAIDRLRQRVRRPGKTAAGIIGNWVTGDWLIGDMKKLSIELLDEIAKRLAQSIHPERIYLFGSHAAGNADADSDIDLLAVAPDTERSTREIPIEGRSSLSDLLIPFDLIVCTKSQFDRYADVKNTIMNQVLCDGRLVYGP